MLPSGSLGRAVREKRRHSKGAFLPPLRIGPHVHEGNEDVRADRGRAFDRGELLNVTPCGLDAAGHLDGMIG